MDSFPRNPFESHHNPSPVVLHTSHPIIGPVLGKHFHQHTNQITNPEGFGPIEESLSLPELITPPQDQFFGFVIDHPSLFVIFAEAYRCIISFHSRKFITLLQSEFMRPNRLSSFFLPVQISPGKTPGKKYPNKFNGNCTASKRKFATTPNPCTYSYRSRHRRAHNLCSRHGGAAARSAKIRLPASGDTSASADLAPD